MTSEQLRCVLNIQNISSIEECLPMCDGLLVTSFIKTDNKEEADVLAPGLFEEYNKYKQAIKFPSEIKSRYTIYIT